MSTSQVALLAAWILIPTTVFFATTIGIPAIARIFFTTRADELRDRCVDMTLDGRLDADPPVKEFIRLQETMVTHARLLSFRQAFAFHAVARRMGKPITPQEPSYNALSPTQRKLMHELDQASTDNLRRYLISRSPVGWLLSLVGLVERCVRPARRALGPTSVRLAEETASQARQSVSEDGDTTKQPFGRLGRPRAHAIFGN